MINTFELKTKVEALLREFPELQDDEVLRLDTLEGSTDLHEILSVLVDRILHQKAIQAGIKGRIDDLKERKTRYERKEEGLRKLAKEVMDVALLRKLTLPEATLSIRASPPSVVITDETILPATFWRVKREPSLVLIKDAIRDGVTVPGASLNNAPDTLAIHTK